LSPEADLGPRLLRGCFPQRTELSPLRASRLRASADPSGPPLLPSQPFNEAFDIVRFRECELQHSRWAMLGLVGAVVAEGQTGISWVDAGKVLNEQPSYLGFDINVPVTTLVVIETLSMGFAEIKRSSGAYPPRVSSQRTLPGRRATLPNNAVFFIHPRRRRQYFHDVTMMIDCPTDRIILPRSSITELDSNKRCYPGGYFDPLGFATSADDAAVFKLQTAELKHGRLAMVGMLGISAQALKNGLGPLEALQTLGN